MFCHPKDATWPHLDDWKGRFSSFVIQKDATWLHFEAKLGGFLDQGMGVKWGNVLRFQAWAHLDGFGRVDSEVLSSKRCYLTSSWCLWKSRFWGFVIQKVLFDLILMTGRVDFQVLSSKRCNLTSFWWLWKAGFSEKWNPHRFSPHLKPPGPPGASSSWWLLEE